MANVAQESLLFWEYTEDFRRGHPNSTQPLISITSRPPDLTPTSSTETNNSLRQWAEGIYNCFIADGSPMQVAISGEAKAAIEKIILDETAEIPFDLFKQTQNQLFNHLKFQLYPSFAQRTSYRGILMSAVAHKVHQVSLFRSRSSDSPPPPSPVLCHWPDLVSFPNFLLYPPHLASNFVSVLFLTATLLADPSSLLLPLPRGSRS
jgi:hypothetical protein